ncbi:MAG TPA: cytochrome c3 family protein [Bryobacterales bacterium]|nr:cytochrome c3 family protein [Bryobacterales bacterium]
MNCRWLILLCALGAATTLAEQPVLFPHNKHVALGLNCLDCHPGADKRAAAGLPSVRKCMLCHEKLATEKPEVKKVREYAARRIEIPWERVYAFSPTALVKFRHAPHYRARIDCTTCHGDVAKETVAQPLVKHTMGRCLDCHRQRHATEDCAACHY